MRESVKLFIFGSGRPFTCYCAAESFFYNHLSVTDHSILSGLFWSYNLHHYFNIDNCLNSVFKPVCAGKRGVCELLDQYVNSWIALSNVFSYVVSYFCVCIYIYIYNLYIYIYIYIYNIYICIYIYIYEYLYLFIYLKFSRHIYIQMKNKIQWTQNSRPKDKQTCCLAL